MALYVSNRDGDGKTDEQGHYRLQTRILKGGVLGTNSLKVEQNSPLGMSVKIKSGDYRLEVAAGYSYTGWLDPDASVTIATADPANPRITTIVLFIDKSAPTSPSPPNNPGIPKFMAVNGTAAPVPAAPNDTAVQAAVGSGNPYMRLADVTVPTAASQIVDANIADLRVKISLSTDVLLGTDLLATVGPLIYPVGSLYFNYSNSANPSTILGFGTWVALAGRFLVGIDGTQTEFDTINETGGAKTNTHWHWQTVGTDPTMYAEVAGAGSGRTRVITVNRATFGPTGSGVAGSREDGTYDATISILPPYMVVYMWRRTA